MEYEVKTDEQVRDANHAALVAKEEEARLEAEKVAVAKAERARYPRLRMQAILTELQKPHIPSDQVHALTVALRGVVELLLETAPALPAEKP